MFLDSVGDNPAGIKHKSEEATCTRPLTTQHVPIRSHLGTLTLLQNLRSACFDQGFEKLD